MRKTKKCFSMILAVVLLAAGTALPADATFDMPDDAPTAAVVTDSTGNELSFVGKDTENGFVLEYYFNGSLDRIYQIPADVSNGEKITAYSVESGKAYYLAASQGTEICAAEILPQAAGPYRDVGYISYNYSSALGSSTVCDVQLSTSRGSSSYRKSWPAASFFADMLAEVSGELLAYGLSRGVTPSAAASILLAMIAYCGSDIVNGVITLACQDTYVCVSETSYIQTRITGDNLSTTHNRIYTGNEKWATVHSYSGYEEEYSYEGITARTWFLDASARTYWTDAFPNKQFPGIASVSN